MWELIDTGENSGEFNMGFDLALVEKCRTDNIFYLRFYKWNPYAISLGYNQNNLAKGYTIDKERCSQDMIDIVRRPTGGRAVLHSEELTYSVITKSTRPARVIYGEIAQAILNGLKQIDESNNELRFLSLTVSNPDILKLSKTGMYNLCFNTAIKNEINLNGKKLVGSAQRDFGDVVLQHGSILIGNHHKNIVNYFYIDENIKQRLRKEIDEKTICLNDILKRNVTYEETAEALVKGFESTLKIEFSFQ